MRRGLLLLLALLAGNLWSIVSEQVIRPKTPPADPRVVPGRRTLQFFAEGVSARTRPRETILFLLPASEADGGLVNHRLRYALPGRYVTTVPAERHDWVAAWRTPAPPGEVVWRCCDGVLLR
jgi:hypothetical protein